MAYIYDDSQTYTGEIVNFTSTDKAKITSVSVHITPTQDLHGYSKPWPEGGGKNIYNPSWASPTNANSSVTVNGEEIHVVTTGGTTYTGMASQSAHDLPAGTYYVKFKVKTGAVTGTGGLCGLRRRSNNTFAVTSSFSSGTLEYSFSGTATEPCYFSVLGNGGSTGDSQASDFTLYDLIISTEDVDYEPYSNICPITGRTSAKIYRFGKNLFNKNGVSPSDVTITQNSSGFRIVSNANGTYKACSGGFLFQTLDFPDGTEVTFSAHSKVNSGKARIGIRRVSDNNLVAYSSLVSSGEADLSCTYTYDKSIPVYLSMFCTWDTSEAGDVEYTDIQIEIGSTKTAYVPYARNTYAVDWTTQAGTVYGGTLDVVTGVLTANRITYAFDGTESFTNYATGIVCNKDMPVGYSVAGSDILCSHSTTAYIRFSNSSKSRVEFKKAYFGVSSGDELKAKLAAWSTNGEPLQYSYELATPLTYQLTPKQIAALTENYVWASNGASITVVVSDVLHDFQGWLLKVGSGMTLVPTEMIKAETYKVSPNQRMEETAERDSTGVLWRETVPNMPPKIEFNTPAAYDTDVNALNAIFRAAYSNEQERKLTVAFYDPEENVYKSWECYMPNIDFPIRTIDIDAKTIFYDEIRYAFIGY